MIDHMPSVYKSCLVESLNWDRHPRILAGVEVVWMLLEARRLELLKLQVRE